MVRGKGGRIGNPRTFRFIFIAIYRLLPPFPNTTRRTTIPVNIYQSHVVLMNPSDGRSQSEDKQTKATQVGHDIMMTHLI